MVYRTEIKIKPTDLTDLTVTTDLSSWNLEQFTIEDNALIGGISIADFNSNVTISSTGYVTQTIVYSNIPPTIYLIPVNEAETLSDGTNNYPIADKISRLMLEDKADKSEIPVIPTVNNATLTIQKNGTTVNTFTANASSNVTANITVPTNTNELTNGAGFITGINSSDVTTALGYTPANDSNVVKTTGNQTISNTKTFTTNLVRKTDLTAGTPPTSDTSGSVILIRDSNDTNIGGLNYTYYSTGAFNVNLRANNPANTSSYANLRIGYTENGTVMTEAPTPNEDTNLSKQIDTVGARNTKLQNYVNLSDSQTISGTKTFSSKIVSTNETITETNSSTKFKYLSNCYTDFVKGSTPSGERWYTVNLLDSGTGSSLNKNSLGRVLLITDTSGNTSARLRAYKNVNDSEDNGEISVYYPASGNPYATCPTPTEDTTSSKQIDTVGARNTKLSNYVGLSSNNTFTGDNTFEKEIKAELASYVAYNGNTNNLPYKKIGEVVLTGTNASAIVPFLYFRTNTEKTSNTYLGKIVLRTDGTTAGHINTGSTGIVLNEVPDYINSGDINFYVLYKESTPDTNKVTFELWVYVKNTWTGFSITPLKQSTGGTSYSMTNWTWYNNPTGVAEIPSGYTGQIEKNIISNYITTPTASDDSKKVANTEFVHDAIALDAVTLTGNQDVHNRKRFDTSDSLMVMNDTFTKGNIPDATKYWNLTFVENNGTNYKQRLGAVEAMVDTSGNVENRLIAYKNLADNSTNDYISMHYPASGNAYATCPTPTEDTTGSTQIDTVGARNTKLANYAALGSANTFTNTNTISGANKTLIIKNTNITRGTAPSAAVNQTYILGKDSADKSTWAIYHTWGTDKAALTRLICYKGTTTDTAWSGIGVGYDSSGVAYTVAPTPNEDTTSSTQIDTVGARNTKLASYATTSAMNSVISTSPYLVLYGTSSSAADATAKIVEISSSYATTPTISAGQLLIVKPTITSTVADSTITVQKSSTTLLAAKTMKYNNTNITTSTDSIVWSANIPSIFVYDGTYWVFLGHGLDNNTTYSAMSVSEGTTGTATSSRVMRADYLKQIIEGLAISQTNTYYDSSSSTLYIG